MKSNNKIKVIYDSNDDAHLWVTYDDGDNRLDYSVAIPPLPTIEETALQINAETIFRTASSEQSKYECEFDDEIDEAPSDETAILSQQVRGSILERRIVADSINHFSIDGLFEIEDMRGIFFKFESINDEHGHIASYAAKIDHIDTSFIGSQIFLKMLFIANAHVKHLNEQIANNTRIASIDRVALAGQNRTLRIENQSTRDLHETFAAMYAFEQSKNKILIKQLDIFETVMKQFASTESWEPALDGRLRTLILNNDLDGGYTLCQAALDHPIMKA